ncbi:hypothetical protein QZM56_40210, partial [Burkholderia contaminans]
VAEIGGKGAVAFGDGNPPPSTKLEFRKDSSFYRGDNYFAAGGSAAGSLRCLASLSRWRDHILQARNSRVPVAGTLGNVGNGKLDHDQLEFVERRERIERKR